MHEIGEGRCRITENIADDANTMLSEVVVADWSGECLEDPNAVGGSGRVDRDAFTGAGPGQYGPTEGVPDRWD